MEEKPYSRSVECLEIEEVMIKRNPGAFKIGLQVSIINYKCKRKECGPTVILHIFYIYIVAYF